MLDINDAQSCVLLSVPSICNSIRAMYYSWKCLTSYGSISFLVCALLRRPNLIALALPSTLEILPMSVDHLLSNTREYCPPSWMDLTWECPPSWMDLTWECRPTWVNLTWECRPSWVNLTWECRPSWVSLTWECRPSWLCPVSLCSPRSQDLQHPV